jgi:hypothetical protein
MQCRSLAMAPRLVHTERALVVRGKIASAVLWMLLVSGSVRAHMRCAAAERKGWKPPTALVRLDRDELVGRWVGRECECKRTASCSIEGTVEFTLLLSPGSLPSDR